MNKRLITIFLAILLICTLCVTIVACGDKDNNDDANPNGEQTDTPSTDTPAPDDGGSSPIEPSPDDGGSSPIEPSPDDGGNSPIEPSSSNLVFELKTNDTYEVAYYTGNPISVVIPATYNGKAVTSIGDGAFYDCDSLSSITIPNSVTSIGERAFRYCDSLTSVTIGNSVTSIGISAFRDCTSLSSVNYLGTIEQWCGITFGGYSANPLSYGAKLYLNGELVEDLVIPSTVTEIKDHAFRGYTSLTSVTIPNSVTSIGYDAFSRCTSLTSVTIPNSVTSIGDGAFADCDSLSSVTIGNSVTSIGTWAFQNCTSITSVNYLGTIEQWCGITFGNRYANPLNNGAKLYLNGELVEDLVIPNTVTEIKDCAFFGCDSLTSVTIPDSVTRIGWYAFFKCDSLTSVTIPDSVTSIGEEAFDYCTSLSSVTIGNSVTSIRWAAFASCNNLSKVYYNGTKEEWSGISISDDNDYLTDATRYYYSETEPVEEGNYWHYVGGVPTPW